MRTRIRVIRAIRGPSAESVAVVRCWESPAKNQRQRRLEVCLLRWRFSVEAQVEPDLVLPRDDFLVLNALLV